MGKDCRKWRSESISDIEKNVGWIMFALKAAATAYYAHAFAVWWIKSLRDEVEEN